MFKAASFVFLVIFLFVAADSGTEVSVTGAYNESSENTSVEEVVSSTRNTNEHKGEGVEDSKGIDAAEKGIKARKSKQRMFDEDVETEKRDTTCDAPPGVEGAVVTTKLEGIEFALGTKISYHCDFGYISRGSGNFSSTCKIDEQTGKAKWTKPDIPCIPRSCGDPGYVANAHRIGNLFTFPNKIEFVCKEGYKLQGLSTCYCQANGEWSGRLPSCEKVYCTIPPHPLNGRVIYSSLEYESELRYECNKGFILKNEQLRTCTNDGTWSNEEPECIEARCKVPESPVRGSVQLVGEPTAGSIALYFCDEGMTMFGSSTSKCLSTGEWTFDPPKCFRSCTITGIRNGRVGRYERVRYNTRYSTGHKLEFSEFYIGESVKHNETVTVQCDHGFMPANSSASSADASDQVLCIDGSWNKAMVCREKTCDDDPPAITNGRPTQFNRKHGSWVRYDCDEHFRLVGNSTVRCEAGKWKGEPPFCQTDQCFGDPPPVENAVPVIESRAHGTTIWYKCNNFFNKVKTGEVKCNYGSWKGNTPVCADTRCYMDQLNFQGLLKPKQTILRSGSQFPIHCERGYKKTVSKERIACVLGQWNIQNNPCEKETCNEDPPSIMNGRPVQFNRQQGSWVQYQCDEHFHLVGTSAVRCEAGKWEGEPPFCQASSSNVVKPLDAVIPQSLNINPSLEPPDSCFCTYDYETAVTAATVNGKQLEPGETVEKGEIVTFNCLYPGLLLQWENGMIVFGTAALICDCEKLTQEQLPRCLQEVSGTNALLYNENMRILPGGKVQLRNNENFEITCINRWSQPKWFPRDDRGMSFREDSVNDRLSTGYFAETMYFSPLGYEHQRKYECYSSDNSGVPSVLELQITEFNIQCPELRANTDRGIFFISYSNDRKVNSLAYYTCRDNSQKLIGEYKRRCLETGKWSGTYPSCEDITCSKFLAYNGLVVLYSNSTKVNSTAKFRCSKHRILVGSNSSVCQQNGQWSNPPPSCELLDIRCPDLDRKGIFTIEYSNDRRVNSTAHFYCREQYKKVEGCNFMTCQQNGEWSGIYPTCVDIANCSTFNESPGLEVSYSDGVRGGSIASFYCQPPYTLVGDSSATCHLNGTWSHPPPACEAPKCSIDDLPYSLPEGVVADFRGMDSVIFVPHGTKISLFCEDGLIHMGSSTAMCGLWKKWDIGNVQCVPGCFLKNVQSRLLIDPVKEFYRFGDFILLSCPPGQKLTTDIERVVCLGKSWSDDLPDCMEATQTSPSALSERRRRA